MRILFLDDDPSRHDSFARVSIGHVVDYVHMAEQAIEAMKETRYDLASLDHDLGGRIYVDSDEEGTGYTVAKAVARKDVLAPHQVIVHSFNPIGAKRMVDRLRDAGVHVIAAPHGTWKPGRPDPEEA